MHSIDDNSSDDSLYFTFDSSDDTLSEINEVYDADIEAMDHHPSTNILYAISGDENDSNHFLMIIDPITGIPDPISGIDLQQPSGYSVDDWEAQAASFHPSTQEMWVALDDIGLVTINLSTGASTLKKSLNEDPEGIAWNNEGTLLYLEYDDDIYSYDHNTDTLTQICNNVDGIESMEFDPNGNLIIGFNNANNISNSAAYDLSTCNRATDFIYDIPDPYDDIETLNFSCPTN
jgi:hypothetical protein